MSGLARLATLVVVLALAACTGRTAWDPFGSSGTRGEAAPRSISLYALNENAEDVVLYLLSTEGIQKVGTIAPERSKTFFIDWDGTRELRVRVEILAGPRYTTNSLSTISPGDRVEVWVPADAERSFIRRR